MTKLIEKISILIAENHTEEAIKLLFEELSPDVEAYSALVLRSSDYKELKAKEVQGVLSGEDLRQQRNRIHLDLLNIAKRLKESPGDRERLANLAKSKASSPKVVQKAKSSKTRNWRWIVPLVLLFGLIILFIFRPPFATEAEYRWWKKPNGKDFGLERLIPGTKNYRDITGNTFAHFAGEDVIVYDKTGKQTLVLCDYATHSSKKIPAKVLTPVSQVYWKMGPDLYRFFIYDKGKKLADLTTTQLGKDLLVYCGENEYTYFIKDYSLTKDEAFHPADILEPKSRAYWKASWENKVYILIDKGLDISKMKPNNFRQGDDLIVDHPIDSVRFRLENYLESQDKVFRAVKIEPK